MWPGPSSGRAIGCDAFGTPDSICCTGAERVGGLTREKRAVRPRRTTWQSQPRVPIGTTAKTGQKCPEFGVRKVVGKPSTNAPTAKGNIMPPHSGKSVYLEAREPHAGVDWVGTLGSPTQHSRTRTGRRKLVKQEVQ